MIWKENKITYTLYIQTCFPRIIVYSRSRERGQAIKYEVFLIICGARVRDDATLELLEFKTLHLFDNDVLFSSWNIEHF